MEQINALLEISKKENPEELQPWMEKDWKEL